MPTSNHNFPTVLVVYGATGDLMAKKIVPALFNLYQEKKLPALFNVIGFSRREWDDALFVEHVTGILLKQNALAAATPEITAFAKLFHFQRGNFDILADYENLAKVLGRTDGEWKVCANKLFYLATPPEHYQQIFKFLGLSHLTDPCSTEEGWTRIIVEKPFGKDQKTAEHLDTLLGKMFKEVQIYRIDHYLAKEMLQNILSFRFSNYLFEDSWNNQSIERITIRAHEKIGVEERGNFYDGVGALRDFGQNHLLQTLALVTMNQPAALTADAIRRERANLLRQLRRQRASEIKETTLRAQYDDYTAIANVKPDSATETYFKIKAQIDSDRWRGVDIILESGKRLGKNRKEIEILFKHPEPCLCPPGASHFQNRLLFTMEPAEGIKIDFWAKKPGLTFEIEKRSLDFLLRDSTLHTQYVEEYKKLLLDCINGDQTLYVSTDEVISMWKFTDPILAGWQKNLAPLKKYRPDSDAITKETVGGEPATAKEMRRELGLVGLGKMGANLARRLNDKGWRVVAYNRTATVTEKLAAETVAGGQGVVPVYALTDFTGALKGPRVVWLMVPAGKAVDEMLFGANGLARVLKRGDIIIDGGNSFYKDTISREKKLRRYGLHFFDVGTSGGPGGARTGACLMVGGDQKIFKQLEPLFKDCSIHNSYQFFTGIGAGHFVKMIHNGIEYGMMQAIAEGYTILKKMKYRLNLKDVSAIYNNGSVIASRLVGWMRKAFELHGENLTGVSGSVGHTGEGEWTVKAAKELGLTAKIIEESFRFRVKSARHPSYTGKLLSALREQLGGHSVK